MAIYIAQQICYKEMFFSAQAKSGRFILFGTVYLNFEGYFISIVKIKWGMEPILDCGKTGGLMKNP